MSRGLIPTPQLRPGSQLAPQQSQFGQLLSGVGGVTNKLFQNPAFVSALANFGQRLSSAPAGQPFGQSFAQSLGGFAPDLIAGQQAQVAAKQQSAQQKLANLLQSEQIRALQAKTAQVGVPETLTPFQEQSLALTGQKLQIQRDAANQIISEKQAIKQTKQLEKEAKFRDSEAVINNNIRLLDELVAHPGLSAVIGAKGITAGFGLGSFPGTDAAGFTTRLDQIKGVAFLEGFKQLKGSGAITEVEGKKAENAIARLSTAQSEVEFKAAIAELQEIMKASLARRQKSGGFTPTIFPQTPTTFPQTSIPSGFKLRRVR